MQVLGYKETVEASVCGMSRVGEGGRIKSIELLLKGSVSLFRKHLSDSGIKPPQTDSSFREEKLR